MTSCTHRGKLHRLQGIATLDSSRTDDYKIEHAPGTITFEVQYFTLMKADGKHHSLSAPSL